MIGTNVLVEVLLARKDQVAELALETLDASMFLHVNNVSTFVFQLGQADITLE